MRTHFRAAGVVIAIAAGALSQYHVVSRVAAIEQRVGRSDTGGDPIASPDSPVRTTSGLVALRDVTSRGRPDAGLAVVLYSDFQCPFCRRFVQTTLPRVEREYIETGRVLFVFKNLPLQNLHPFAMGSAEAAACAGREGKFWMMHDWLFQIPGPLDAATLKKAPISIGLNTARFQTCLDNHETSGQVSADAAEARALGITGTPTFLIGPVEDRAVHVVRSIRGAQQFNVFDRVLKDLLGES